MVVFSGALASLAVLMVLYLGWNNRVLLPAMYQVLSVLSCALILASGLMLSTHARRGAQYSYDEGYEEGFEDGRLPLTWRDFSFGDIHEVILNMGPIGTENRGLVLMRRLNDNDFQMFELNHSDIGNLEEGELYIVTSPNKNLLKVEAK